MTEAAPRLTFRSSTDVRALRPEIQLLYESKRPRAKDEADLEAVRTSLSPHARGWPMSALRTTAPTHPWLESLASPG